MEGSERMKGSNQRWENRESRSLENGKEERGGRRKANDDIFW